MTKLQLTFSCSVEEAIEKIQRSGLWEDKSLLAIETITNRKLRQTTTQGKCQT